MDLLEKNALCLSLFQDGPQTIAALINKTGGIKELMEFFQWVYDNPDRHGMVPHLLQGDDTPDFAPEFEGQPVVWDGVFVLMNEDVLIYVGYAGPGGFGGQVERAVKVTDQVAAG